MDLQLFPFLKRSQLYDNFRLGFIKHCLFCEAGIRAAIIRAYCEVEAEWITNFEHGVVLGQFFHFDLARVGLAAFVFLAVVEEEVEFVDWFGYLPGQVQLALFLDDADLRGYGCTRNGHLYDFRFADATLVFHLDI
jgi:hypothetical protein